MQKSEKVLECPSPDVMNQWLYEIQHNAEFTANNPIWGNYIQITEVQLTYPYQGHYGKALMTIHFHQVGDQLVKGVNS